MDGSREGTYRLLRLQISGTFAEYGNVEVIAVEVTRASVIHVEDNTIKAETESRPFRRQFVSGFLLLPTNLE